MKTLATLSLLLIATCGLASPGVSAQGTINLPMDRVYQGRIQLPDFSGRDRPYATFKTRITNEMRTGPNFAGHYALVEIGCGTGCRLVFAGDVATGQMFQFPYGGEEYNLLSLTYSVKSNYVSAHWVSGGSCYGDNLEWNGVQFRSMNKRVIGSASACENT